MKLLLDTCVSFGAVAPLKAAGHDVIWAGDWPADSGDDEILALAYQEGRILITLDKDFGELAVSCGDYPSGGPVRFSASAYLFDGADSLWDRTAIGCDRDR